MDDIEDQEYKELLDSKIREYEKTNINFLVNFKREKNAETNSLQEDNEDELIRLMIHKFISGEDKDFFDYTTVDENPDYDDSYIKNLDDEELYFDQASHEESNIESSRIKYTGEIDY